MCKFPKDFYKEESKWCTEDQDQHDWILSVSPETVEKYCENCKIKFYPLD